MKILINILIVFIILISISSCTESPNVKDPTIFTTAADMAAEKDTVLILYKNNSAYIFNGENLIVKQYHTYNILIIVILSFVIGAIVGVVVTND